MSSASNRPCGQSFRRDVIPIFDPDDANQDVIKWLYKVLDSRNIFRWTEEITIYYALSKLRGLALLWYDA